MSITARNITKRFGAFTALDDVSVQAPAGELVALLGPSGSGKTTLLRIIAGLDTPDAGSILFEGEDATSRTARDRNVGFVFQHYALFRHMTIFENIAFGLRVRKQPRGLVAERVHELLNLVQLEGLGRRYPSQLSGGQRQRVALARALAARPKVLLLDEPFGALDAKVRKELRRWLRRLHDEIHVTSLFVTHDQEEALEVADRVLIMNHGRVEQVGTPEEVYNKPANPFVLSFLGHVNIFRGRIANGLVKMSNGDAVPEADAAAASAQVPADIAAYARPHDIDLAREAPADGRGTRARVVWVHRAGSSIKIELAVENPDAANPHAGGGGESSETLIVVELPRQRYAEIPVEAQDIVWAVPRDLRVFADYQI
jgi:sulfate transport system ATP-binding protein